MLSIWKGGTSANSSDAKDERIHCSNRPLHSVYYWSPYYPSFAFWRTNNHVIDEGDYVRFQTRLEGQCEAVPELDALAETPYSHNMLPKGRALKSSASSRYGFTNKQNNYLT